MTRRTGKPHGSRSNALGVYEEWVHGHSDELYRFAYRLCGNSEVAEDLIQETFHEAWKSMARLRDQGKARGWLFQILRHRYSRWCRAQAAGPAHLPIDSVPAEALVELAPLSQLIDEDAVQAALDRMNRMFKIPLLMVFVEGLTCQEAANSLDLPLGTILSRIHRAKRQLRALLRSKGDETPVERGQIDSPHFRIGGAP